MASTLYLESYVESTHPLPAELQRIMNTIKMLDERAADLQDQIKRSTDAAMQLPGPGQRSQQDEQELLELQAQIKGDEGMLLQFVEEKVNLAQQAYDLLSMHASQLDETIEQFEADITAAQLDFASFELPAPAKGAAARGPRGVASFDHWDALDALAPPATVKRTSTAGGGGVATTTAQKGKRAREESSAGGAGAAGRAAAAAAAAAAAVPALPADDANGAAAGAGAGAAPPGAAAVQPPLTFMNHELTRNLLDSAPQPQLPGRLLTLQDIKPLLQGRQAEMFWPDDNMWYLIEIHRVNAADRSATIVYRTGEVEELNLAEIAQDGHMSLIELG